MNVTEWAAQHRKLLTFMAGALITLATSIWGTSNHWVELAILAATGFGVYQVPNRRTE